MVQKYVHGYDESATRRLQDQAATLAELLHSDTFYPEGALVLEAGCGVGGQSAFLSKNSPHAHFISIDIDEDSIAQASAWAETAGVTNVTFRQGDIYSLNFAPGTFDHIFVCFVLEHLNDPLSALADLQSLLTPGGTITVIEGDHGSTLFHPENEAAHLAISCQATLQRMAGGDAMIGRRLYPLMTDAGFQRVRVSPRIVYADSSRPRYVEGFTKNTFTAMISGIRDSAIKEGLIMPAVFDKGIEALHRTAEADGVFCYTFFKAIGVREADCRPYR